METFKKRRNEMQRLDRQTHKAGKRKEIKGRKAAGIGPEPDESSETAALVSASPSETVVPLTN